MRPLFIIQKFHFLLWKKRELLFLVFEGYMSQVTDFYSEILDSTDLERQASLSMQQIVSEFNCEIYKSSDLRKKTNALFSIFTKNILLKVALKRYAKEITESSDPFNLFVSKKMNEQKIPQSDMALDVNISPPTLGRLLNNEEKVITVNLGVKMMAQVSLTEEEKLEGLMLLLWHAGVFDLLKLR